METPEEVWQAISQIVVHYRLLECDKCAIAVMQFLQENGMSGKILRLKTKRRNEVFITWSSARRLGKRFPLFK